MNLRYRIAQLKNSLFTPAKRRYKWIFIYGVPRSGTTYFYQELMQLGRLGVSDFDLGKFVPVIEHIEQSGYIPLDTASLKKHIRNQLLLHAAPGGGSKYDFIIKQVNTNLKEYELLFELMGGEPEEKYFLYREPKGWLPSAMKKFDLDESGAVELYNEAIHSFRLLKGTAIEYGQEINTYLNLKIKNRLEPFNEGQVADGVLPNEFLKTTYEDFLSKKSL